MKNVDRVIGKIRNNEYKLEAKNEIERIFKAYEVEEDDEIKEIVFSETEFGVSIILSAGIDVLFPEVHVFKFVQYCKPTHITLRKQEIEGLIEVFNGNL